MGVYTDRDYSVEISKGLLLTEIDIWLASKVEDVFDSSASGLLRRYWCSPSEQLRFINGKVANVTLDIYCSKTTPIVDEDPEYAWLAHTSAECGKLQTAYVNFSKAASQIAANARVATLAATTLAQLDTIFTNLHQAIVPST